MTSAGLTSELRETLAVFGSDGEPRTTPEVAAHLAVGRRTTYNRLRRLAEAGALETKKVGANARVWWHSDGERREASAASVGPVLDTVGDGVFAVDGRNRFTTVNEAFTALVGRDRDRLLGAHVSAVLDEAAVERVERAHAELPDGDGSASTYEVEFTTPEGRTRTGEVVVTSRSALGEAGGSERVGVVRDVTAARRREAALATATRRYRALVDNFPNGTVSLVDPDLRYRTVGGEVTEAVADDTSALVGERVADVLPDDIAPTVAANYARALDGSTVAFETTVGETRYRSTFVPIRGPDGAVTGAMGISIDVTRQRETEATLRRHVRQQECLAGLGQDALAEESVESLIEKAVDLVRESLGTSHCTAMRFDADDRRLRFVTGVGWDDGVVGEVSVPADDGHHAGYTFNTGREAVVGTLAEESRFTVPRVVADHGIRAGITARIGPADDPWGVLAVHDTESMAFSGEDTTFVQSVANVLAAAVDGRRQTRELDAQRTALAAVNSLNTVARGITGAVLDQSTRAEIERVVCARLVESESYRVAWIGEADDDAGEVRSRVAAGGDGDCGDDDEVHPPPRDADRAARRITETALRTETAQFASADEVGPGDAAAAADDSIAAVPITHEGTSYGVLTVHTARRAGFGRTEREVIEQVATVAAHAIAAADRKQALVSDELVEVTFRIDDVYGALETAIAPTGRYTFDHMNALGDGEFLVHGTADPEAVPHLEDVAEVNPLWRSVRTFERGRTVRFELHAVDLPVFSAIAARGGSIEDIVVEDGDLSATILFAPSVDIGGMLDTIERYYPVTRLRRRRQVTRSRETRRRITHEIASSLTDRQRTALETAYYGGYFEWPRAKAAEEVAESMGVAPSTFHQHLRKAEKKVYDAVYTAPLVRDDSER